MEEYLRRVFPGSAEEFCKKAEAAMASGERMFVVTANPEILMAAADSEEVRTLLLSPEANIVPDGISVVKAMQLMHLPVTERIAGVDLADKLLHSAGRAGKSVYLLGAKEEVVATLAKKLKTHYPGMTLHYHNGYDGDKDAIMKGIADQQPDLVLVALGVPAQDLLIHRHLQEFSRGVLIGVGGSFDVLSGMKRRAPAFFRKTNTEWLYRILREPSRLKRFWRSNVKFLGVVRKAARSATK